MVDFHDGVTRGLFAREILRELGVPKNAKNMVSMLAWMEGENTKAKNNPLATTHHWNTREKPFNSAGVKHYATLADGIGVTLETLRSGRYTAILAALKAGTSVHATAAAIIASPWGTQHVPWKAVNANIDLYAGKLISTY